MGMSRVSSSSSWRISSPQVVEGHGGSGGGVQQGSGLHFHVRPDVVPGLGHLVLGEIDLVGDLGFGLHRDDSFQSTGPFCGMRQKKTFIPTKRTCNRFLWDKSLENFCGATQIGDTIARSAVCKHIPFLGNGGKARRRLIGAPAPFGPPSAVHSPELFLPPLHCRRLAGRNALWVLLCLIGFCFELGDSINPGTAVVNPHRHFFQM